MYKNRNAKVLWPAKEGRPQDDKKEGADIVTTATAGNLAGHPEKDKEKVEKRRALGRGLESLLPGPRVVRPPQANSAQDVAAASAVPVSGVPTGAEAPGSSGTDPALKGRSSTVATAVEPNPGDRAPHTAELRSAGQPMAAVPTNPSSLAAAPSTPAAVLTNPSSLAGVPTNSSMRPVPANSSGLAVAHASALPGVHAANVPPTVHGANALAESAIATGSVDYDPFGDAPKGEVIEIQAVADTRVPSNLVVNVAIADVDKNPFQTRYVDDDDALEELADSIKANGVVQPIVVRPATEQGRYILVMGERRLHASKKAGKTHIPALVRRISEQQAAEMTIIENLQREDLSPLEQAQAFRVLSSQFNLTQQQISERVGLSRVSVANYMRLLKLPREVMEMLAEKRINFSQAKELLKLGDNDRIAEAALYAVKKGMNIEQIEMLVLRMDGLLDPLPDMPGVKKEKTSGGARWVDPNVRSAQVDLERLLGVRVRIRDRKGKGKIVIEYSTVDDYERVVEMLRGKK